MLHWKTKLAYLLVAALAVLAAFAGAIESACGTFW